MKEIIVILHNIRSLYNVGSIFRTADAAGCKRVYLCGITPAPLDSFGKIRPQFAKVSLGAEKNVPWDASAHSTGSGQARPAQATLKLLEKLRADGYKIFAIEQAKNSIPYYRVKHQGSRVKKVALVLGNEVKGLPVSILKLSDKILEIPMRGKKESLNVAVVFGIVAYHLNF